MPLVAGVATTDITPRVPIDLNGFIGRENPATSVRDPLRATALVLQDGDVRTLVLSADVLLLPEVFPGGTPTRSALARAAGCPEGSVLACATHTHSAPVTRELSGCGRIDPEYLATFCRRLEDVARRAASSLEPVTVRAASVPAPLARNRRREDGPRDDALTVLELRRTGADPFAVVVNFSCHPVHLRGRSVSADYPGELVRRLEESLGCPAIFLTGACGDVNPVERGDEAMIALASGLHGRVLEILDSAEDLDESLRTASAEVELLYEPLPPREEIEACRAEQSALAHRPGNEGRIARAMVAWCDRCLSEPGPERQAAHGIRISALGLGNLMAFCVPAEVFSATSLELRAESKAPVLFAAYGAGCVGYLPTRDEYALGGYEVDSAHRYYGARRPSPENAGRLLRGLAGLAARLG